VRCWSAEITTVALHSIYSGQSRFDLWRQGLADDIGIEAAKVLADGAQKLLIRDQSNLTSTLADASHHCLQITYLVDVAGH
jgi:hypothetical protein